MWKCVVLIIFSSAHLFTMFCALEIISSYEGSASEWAMGDFTPNQGSSYDYFIIIALFPPTIFLFQSKRRC